VEGIYRLMQSQEHLPVNIGNSEEISIKRFAEVINQLTNNPAGLITRFADGLGDDPQRRQPDISRAKALLDWQPKVSMEDGLAKTVSYFKLKLGL
jgi:dTDP-glucose 4,6-dehydratase